MEKREREREREERERGEGEGERESKKERDRGKERVGETARERERRERERERERARERKRERERERKRVRERERESSKEIMHGRKGREAWIQTSRSSHNLKRHSQELPFCQNFSFFNSPKRIRWQHREAHYVKDKHALQTSKEGTREDALAAVSCRNALFRLMYT